jgi:uncharacterized membrane protein YhaH (DUF805 family)
MTTGARLAELLFDPRGRVSRQDLLAAATVMLALDIGLAGAMDGSAVYAVKGLAYWIGCVGVIKRLHDVGKTGWWLLWGAGLMCIWSAILGFGIVLTGGFETLQPASVGYIALLASLMIPALGMTLWLHLAPGEPARNRYGAPSESLWAPASGPAGERSPAAADL